MKNAGMLTLERLTALLDGHKGTKIGLIGDVCIDAYWRADMRKSELSRETPHYTLPVVKECYSLGAGGNVAANLAALGTSKLLVVGILGKDWRGQLVRSLFEEQGISTDYLVTSGTRVTNAYCKPYRKGINDLEYEDPRIDFINLTPVNGADEVKLLSYLEIIAKEVDVLCVSDQNQFGCITEGIREKICELGRQGLTIIADSRDNIGAYRHILTKPNEVEAARAVNLNLNKGEVFENSLQDYALIAETLSKRNHAPVCCTLGNKGCLLADSDNIIHVPAHPIKPPIDICGAGDTFLAAFAATTAAGATMAEAAQTAVLASEIVIQKIGTTGSASDKEIITLYKNVQELTQ
jgi:rfaE bifunctional protein kinase chain/domain